MTDTHFKLVHNKDRSTLKTGKTLYEIWKFCKNELNIPQDYSAEEYNRTKLVGAISAYSLVEDFKNKKQLPISLKN